MLFEIFRGTCLRAAAIFHKSILSLIWTSAITRILHPFCGLMGKGHEGEAVMDGPGSLTLALAQGKAMKLHFSRTSREHLEFLLLTQGTHNLIFYVLYFFLPEKRRVLGYFWRVLSPPTIWFQGNNTCLFLLLPSFILTHLGGQCGRIRFDFV